MGESNKENSPKMTERRANVYENKGPVFHRLHRNGNVTENKCSYGFNTGMLLKTKEVDGRWGRAGFKIPDSGGRKAGVRCEVSGARFFGWGKAEF
jgi:hypothetical protein